MKAHFQRALFIFRRDLRLHDNSALIKALESSKEVLCIFIFDPCQIDATNSYRGDHCVQFMLESLIDLDQRLRERGSRLFSFYGEPVKILDRLQRHFKFEAVFLNSDYTPFSRARDEAIQNWSTKAQVELCSLEDSLLVPIQEGLKADGKPYTVYTPFFKRCSKLDVRAPLANNARNFHAENPICDFEVELERFRPKSNPNLAVKGGRSAARAILQDLSGFQQYHSARDFPALSATTHLSAHLKFGTVSVREVFHKIVKSLGGLHTLIRELYWRDFFHHIVFHFPHVLQGCFHKIYDSIDWHEDKEKFQAWSEGQTGFPIVDAGMRELNQTGFMHNRVRMITASFLVKDLHINWREGERYFATKLVDYDASVNNGNWQWASSTGCDAQPYFRIFNPWLQQGKFDADCIYIKRWLPELQSLSAKQIHNLAETRPAGLKTYPSPMLDHAEEKAVCEQMYENARLSN